MAEAIFRQRCQEAKRDHIIASSMGIHGLDSQPVSALTLKVCIEHHLDTSKHLSRPLRMDELNEAHLIFTMDIVQKKFIELFFPRIADRVALLTAWPEKESKKSNIKDPMNSSLKVHQEVFDIIEKQVDRISPIIFEMYG
jgi:protein-tyrosine-phosphatase